MVSTEIQNSRLKGKQQESLKSLRLKVSEASLSLEREKEMVEMKST